MISNAKKIFKRIGVGEKFAIPTVLLISTLFIGFTLSLGNQTKELTKRQALKEVNNITNSVYNSVNTFDIAMGEQIIRFGDLLLSNYKDNFEVNLDKKVVIKDIERPTLTYQNNEISLDTIDKFTHDTSVYATFFVKDKDDFVRVATSIKNEKGERVVGTVLDHASPAYELLKNGKSYKGISILFNKPYTTNYRPLLDKEGKVIGAAFVGLDVSKEMDNLVDSIKTIKVGQTGHVTVLQNNPINKKYGVIVADANNQGKSALEMKDSDNKEYMKEILLKRSGSSNYFLDDNHKIKNTFVDFKTYDSWQWTIISFADIDEITSEVNNLYTNCIVGGIIALLVLSLVLYYSIKQIIIKPLLDVAKLSHEIALGNLTVVSKNDREDEIGTLYKSINEISQNLSNIVGKVRESAYQIQSASNEIANGNLDLSSRTESQASSLEETASSMEELTSIIKNNAEQAYNVSSLVTKTVHLAENGGNAMKQVVENMEQINDESKKMYEIINVIDSIAFQTNILSLNAAVEAARAGEQGRGFAVVASEVRNLAQRSANAAKEIKQLINNSVSKIEIGNGIVNEAGNNIKEIVVSVSNVDTILKEIAQANTEQSRGIEHINTAISEMDSVTQSNAALVEEAAAAASSLKDLAGELTESVSVFKL